MDVELELKALCQHSSVEQFCFTPIIFIQLNRELYFPIVDLLNVSGNNSTKWQSDNLLSMFFADNLFG